MNASESPESYRGLIASVAPALAGASLEILSEGWDSVAVVAGDRLFKFPRKPAAEVRLRREANLLKLIRSHVHLPVPALTLYDHPRLFSEHEIIPGRHLVAADYPALSERQRDRLADKLALLHAQLQDIDPAEARDAGALPIDPWLEADAILDIGSRHLPAQLRPLLEQTIAAYKTLPDDDIVYGHFDGHGWNMAFDHERGELNGVYDFADSGFGRRHQDLCYSAFISPDLTRRVVEKYAALTGRAVDLDAVLTIHGTLRFWEFAAEAEAPNNGDKMLDLLRMWADAITSWRS